MPKEAPAAAEKAAPEVSERELAIRARVAAGLSRAQAEEVQAAQDAHDAALAKAKK